MVVSGRRFLAVVLVVLAGPPAVRAQQQSAVMNPNMYVNPYQTVGRQANTIVLGGAPQNAPPALAVSSAGNYAPASPAPGTPGGSPSNPGGYSDLLANTGSGGYDGSGLSGGYSYATQWMQNPYEGYLSGAAAVTNANAQWRLTIQQAKLYRQEAVRSAMDTRRKIIEEAEYERNHLPDPEKIRQADLARELDRARTDPPLTEVWSGRALNALLRHLVKQRGQAVPGPGVALSEDTLKWINLAPGDSRANAGLLRDRGALHWPQPLMEPRFKEARDDLGRRVREAVEQLTVNPQAEAGTLARLRADLKALDGTLEASAVDLSPSRYVEARRFLNQVGDAVKALEDRNASNYFTRRWAPRGKDAAELVQFMSDQGLQFAPATPGGEAAYRALYRALVAFDANTTRVADSGGGEKE